MRDSLRGLASGQALRGAGVPGSTGPVGVGQHGGHSAVGWPREVAADDVTGGVRGGGGRQDAVVHQGEGDPREESGQGEQQHGAAQQGRPGTVDRSLGQPAPQPPFGMWVAQPGQWVETIDPRGRRTKETRQHEPGGEGCGHDDEHGGQGHGA
ncbi:hypothetical protein ACFUJY_22445 [Streptomyces sp. NPDC057249]|uniref:hypothetical protein n=1 Tax=Streptomyces sp. NPDC057249 TaxID=3346067 RepID=UPI00362C47AF